MSTRSTRAALSQAVALGAFVLMAVGATPAAAQVCGPDPDGRVANAVYRDTTIIWEPLVEYERMTLKIAGPCEDIVRVFGRGEPIFFDIREIERVQDGAYTWELSRTAAIDSATEKALAKSRALGDDSIWWELWQGGRIPQGPYVESGSFLVADGRIVPPDLQEEGKSLAQATTGTSVRPRTSAPSAEASPARLSSSTPAAASRSGLTPIGASDQVIPDDLIVQGSECVGLDCVNNENFSFDTIRLKENNLRIHFDDTSTIAGYPANDWRLIANDSASGGQSKFSIEDSTGAKTPFTVEAGATTNSIYVDSTGRVGFRTATPVLDLHVATSNTPGIRLEQNNSGGFTAQTWDIAANEANFFVRDVTGGSTLPFRIRPGAPTSSIDINADGEVGIGTASPTEELTVKSDAGNSDVLVVKNSTVSNTTIFRIFETTAGDGLFSLFSTAGSEQFRLTGSGGHNFLSGTVGINCNASGGFDFGIKTGTGSTTTCNTGTFSVITAGNSTFTTSSSRSIKENLEPIRMPDILDKIAAIDVYKYDFIEGPKDRVGLMAEDFHQVFQRGSDKLINGQEVEMALWLAVKQLTAQNQELMSQNQELSRRLTDLETRVTAAQTEKTP